MTVKCIGVSLTDEQRKKLGASHTLRTVYQLSVGTLYTVLGITLAVHSRIFGSATLFEIRDDAGRCYSIPACLFDIVDARPSKFWRVRKRGELDVALWPEEFYREFFHDDLSEGVPDVVSAFANVVRRLQSEHAEEDVAPVK